MLKLYFFVFAFHLLIFSLTAQNYNETKVPLFDLPPLLDKADMETTDWEQRRRKEILQLFRDNVYGTAPKEQLKTKKEVREFPFQSGNLNGIQKEIRICFYNAQESDSVTMTLLLILPLQENVPVFLGMNAYGNHTIHNNTDISLGTSWVNNNFNFNIYNHQAPEAARGVHSNRWPVERLLSRGYGLATFCYNDLHPDHTQGATASIKQLFKEKSSWNALSVWAWGLQQAMNHLETEARIDAKRVSVIGHSRRGKAALWAGAQDERFAAVISNESGCGGAALSKRVYGETVKIINTNFPHWFCDNFKQFNGQEANLPLDQHMLLALVAPRLLYVASAKEDRWADPRGEYLSAFHASKVYNLYGLKGLEKTTFPAENNALQATSVGYHLRSGRHDLSRYDWERFMDFLDSHLR